MEVVSIGFVGSLYPAHCVISTATLSRWAHCYAILDTGNILDSTAAHGVSVRPYTAPTWPHWERRVDLSTVDVSQRAQMAEHLLEQVGKPYDFGWLVGFPLFSRTFQDPRRWVCSELIASAAIRSGIIWPLPLQRVTPGQLLKEVERWT